MGLGGIGITELLVILAIILLLFGTKRLRNLGSDLGSAIKGFRNSMSGDEDKKLDRKDDEQDKVIDIKAEKVESEKK